MKNIIYKIFSLVIAITFIFGCNKQMDELSQNPNRLTLSSATPENINAAVIGMYGYIGTARNLGASGMKMAIHRGDEASTDADYGQPGQYNTNYNASWYTIVQPFSLMYTVASAATQVIETTPKVDFRDQVQKNAYLGEAYFGRAFAHYWLLVNYRNIAPVRKVAQTRADYIRAQEDPKAVWQFIIDDLKQAKSLLPKKGYWTGNNMGRVTSGSATALLGKSYLYMTGIENKYGASGVNFYSEAAKEFGEIISGLHGNYSLVPNYADNFNAVNENNNESLFEIQFVGDLVNTGFNPGLANTGLWNDMRGLQPPALPGVSRSGEAVVHDWVYNAFINSKDATGKIDYRMFGTLVFNDTVVATNSAMAHTYSTARMTGPAGRTWSSLYPSSAISPLFPPSGSRPSNNYKAAFRKWIDLSLSLTNPGNNALWFTDRANGANWRYIRYADVLLMYAECLIQGGTPGSISALDAINQVRTRVQMPPIATADMTTLENERILELSLEGHRFYDLLRWGKLKTRFTALQSADPNFKKFTFYDGFVENKHEWVPIPIDEMNTNPLAKQNPNW